jgi:hypothetical protein
VTSRREAYRQDAHDQARDERVTLAIGADAADEAASIVGHVGCRRHFIDNATANPAATAWVYRVIDKIMALF